jgi:hypothetical protein
MRLCISLFLVLLIAPACKAAQLSPTQVANSFYAWVSAGGGGVPTEKELKPATVFLSGRFSALLRKSLVAEERCVKATPPDLKPPIFEGNLFVDNYEGLTKVISMSVRRQHGQAIVTARLAYADSAWPARVYRWTDQLTLVTEGGKWVVDDVGGRRRRPPLSAILKKYTSKEECGA